MEYYKESDFKKVALIGNVPKEWVISSIQDVALPKKGSVKIGPFGSQIKKSDMVSKGLKVYGQENVIANDFTVGNRYISLEKFETLKSFEIKRGDILITMMGSLGYASTFPEDAQRGIMDSHLLRIQLKTEEASADYLLKLIDSPLIERQIKALSRGAIMSGLNSTTVRSFKIPLPPLAEQEAIVRVLGVVDSAIELADQIIAKSERLKRGLMHQLLTHGIAQSGSASKREEWQNMTLEEACIISSGLVDPEIEPYSSMLHVGPDNIEKESGFLSGMRKASELNLISGKYLFDEQVVLYSKIRPNLMKVALPDFQGICSADIYPIKPKNGLDKTFLFYLLSSERFTKYAVSKSARTGIPKINRIELLAYPFLLPTIEEQRKIAAILTTATRKLELEVKEKNKLERLKTSLMDLLLTGKLRIKVD